MIIIPKTDPQTGIPTDATLDRLGLGFVKGNLKPTGGKKK